MISKLKLLEHLSSNYIENEKFIALLEEIDQAIEMISKLKLLEHLSSNYIENEKFIALLEGQLEE